MRFRKKYTKRSFRGRIYKGYRPKRRQRRRGTRIKKYGSSRGGIRL